ncbi:hemolysin family protein [Demetria terragena]|uniref:hemolysin family protein n=1 Tax=Demetria terragena TaxID=63959 RepID=UPI0003803A38|nr:hemolysin family protein [Demetria terragena]
MSIGVALSLSLVLLILNAFFVAAEFAVIASKKHRLQDAAESGGRAARAALDASRELTLMLAGAQLGITLCTLGLGALAKPAVKELLSPVLKLTGLPDAFATGIAFALSVAVVVFLHMVVGEMAPKSWAISHPERSATLLALPFRAFTRSVRWALTGLNAVANALVRLAKVDPVDTVADAHGPQELQMLLAQSHEHGVLPDHEHRMLSGALRLEQETLADVTRPWREIVGVQVDATMDEACEMSRSTGRSRLVVLDGEDAVGLVHVRQLLIAPATSSVREQMHEIVSIPAAEPLIDALETMRARRAHLALVTSGSMMIGLASLEDVLERVVGRFDDESDLIDA